MYTSPINLDDYKYGAHEPLAFVWNAVRDNVRRNVHKMSYDTLQEGWSIPLASFAEAEAMCYASLSHGQANSSWSIVCVS